MDSIIIFGAKYLFVAVTLIFVYAWLVAPRRYKIEIASATIIASVLALIFKLIGSKLYYDPRPFVTHHLRPLVIHAPDNGFPSEHTIFCITLASVLFLYRPKLGILAFIVGLVVGAARVGAHIHSPIDIIGGALMGAAAGYIGYRLANYLLKPKANKQTG
jgi:undecaprenyl-diphosphatase